MSSSGRTVVIGTDVVLTMSDSIFVVVIVIPLSDVSAIALVESVAVGFEEINEVFVFVGSGSRAVVFPEGFFVDSAESS